MFRHPSHSVVVSGSVRSSSPMMCRSSSPLPLPPAHYMSAPQVMPCMYSRPSTPSQNFCHAPPIVSVQTVPSSPPQRPPVQDKDVTLQQVLEFCAVPEYASCLMGRSDNGGGGMTLAKHLAARGKGALSQFVPARGICETIWSVAVFAANHGCLPVRAAPPAVLSPGAPRGGANLHLEDGNEEDDDPPAIPAAISPAVVGNLRSRLLGAARQGGTRPTAESSATRSIPSPSTRPALVEPSFASLDPDGVEAWLYHRAPLRPIHSCLVPANGASVLIMNNDDLRTAAGDPVYGALLVEIISFIRDNEPVASPAAYPGPTDVFEREAVGVGSRITSVDGGAGLQEIASTTTKALENAATLKVLRKVAPELSKRLRNAGRVLLEVRALPPSYYCSPYCWL